MNEHNRNQILLLLLLSTMYVCMSVYVSWVIVSMTFICTCACNSVLTL